jgi:hypothetical protein
MDSVLWLAEGLAWLWNSFVLFLEIVITTGLLALLVSEQKNDIYWYSIPAWIIVALVWPLVIPLGLTGELTYIIYTEARSERSTKEKVFLGAMQMIICGALTYFFLRSVGIPSLDEFGMFISIGLAVATGIIVVIGEGPASP